MKLPQEAFYTSRIHLKSAEPCLLLFHNVLNICREKEYRHCDSESCFPFYIFVANCFLAFLFCLLISLSCLILSDSPFKEVSRNSLLHLTLCPPTSLRSNYTCKVGANGQPRVQLLQNISKVLIQTKQCFLK